MITRLSTEETTQLIARGRVGRLGCVEGDSPYVVPVSYLFLQNAIYIHSLPGRKINALRTNPRACFQVDEVEDDLHWRSAIAYGTYQEVTEPDERNRALDELYSRFRNLTPIESVSTYGSGANEVIVFKIRIDSITGVGEL